MRETATAAPRTLLDLLFDDGAAGRCLVAPDGTVVRVNAEWLRSTGFALDDVIGARAVDLFPETRDMALAMHARARAGYHVEVPRHVQRTRGRETWWEGAIDPVPMEGGVGLLVTARNVTPPPRRPGKRARRVRGATDLLAGIREMSGRVPVAVFVKDAEGQFLFANPCFVEMLGRRLDETVGRTVSDVLPPDVARRVEEYDRHVAAGQEVVTEDTIPTARGERTLLVVRFPIELGDGTMGTVGVGVDVTDRKRAESSLRESEARFRVLTDGLPEIVCVLAPDGRAEYINRTWTTFSGLDLEATARAGWMGVLHPDDVEAALACRRRALRSLSSQEAELRYRAADGSYRWFLNRLAPVVERGRVVRFVGAAMDIEESKRAEEHLREADRHKDEFLGMLSHELRNPLAPIRNALYIVDHAPAGGQQARRAMDVVARQVEHLTRLVDDLLDLTRIARGKIELRREDLDLAGLAHRTVEDYRALMQDRRLELAWDEPPAPVRVNGDPARLTQVLGNLLANAAKFTPAGGRVSLSLRAEGDRAILHVRDTGPGIAPEVLPNLFEPFTQARQTLARSEGGLGLGLSLVKGLVALHGGEVAVESGEGAGADFVVSLSLAGSPAETAAALPPRR